LDAADKVSLVVAAIQARRAQDVTVLDLRGLTIIADFFVISTASSSLNLKAQAEAAMDAVHERGTATRRLEGQEESGWLLADLGDVILHVFSAEQREFYQLERLWQEAPRIPVAESPA
jgi:ribosome-associated protein